MNNDFEKYLNNHRLAQNTVRTYTYTLNQYQQKYDTLTEDNLRDYKRYLIKNFKPQTVNLRIRAINCYLESINKEKWSLSPVKVQKSTFFENVISEADYLYFKNCLKHDGEMSWYFIVSFLAVTNANISELVQIKAEHVSVGYLDIYSNNGKVKRIYIPAALQHETMAWLNKIGKTSGYIFVNRHGECITTRGIAGQLKVLGSRYGLDPSVMYPRSFKMH